MKVSVTRDDWYCIFIPEKHQEWYDEIELSEEEYASYKEAKETFEKVQDMLERKICENTNS